QMGKVGGRGWGWGGGGGGGTTGGGPLRRPAGFRPCRPRPRARRVPPCRMGRPRTGSGPEHGRRQERQETRRLYPFSRPPFSGIGCARCGCRGHLWVPSAFGQIKRTACSDDLNSKYITFVASMNVDVSLVAAQSPIMESRAAGDVYSFIAVKQP